MLDAHPAIMEARGVPQGAWPGGYCNQANTAAEENAVLLQHDGKSAAPAYAWMDGKCRNLFVRLKRPIKTGEELWVFGTSTDAMGIWAQSETPAARVKSRNTRRVCTPTTRANRKVRCNPSSGIEPRKSAHRSRIKNF